MSRPLLYSLGLLTCLPAFAQENYNANTGNYNGNSSNYNANTGNYSGNYVIDNAAEAVETTTADESSAADDPFSLNVQVDQNGTVSRHIYTLVWDNAESSLKTIKISDSETGEDVQTINLPAELKLIHKDIFVNGEPMEGFKDKVLDLVDFNFDNFGDLRLLREWPINLSTKGYYVFIYHPLANEYHLNAEISQLENPIPNPKSYRIESATMGGWAGGEFTKKFYSIDKEGKLTVQSKWTQTIKDPIRMNFIRDVRIRLNGALQRICKLEVGAEGKTTVTWGSKRRCKKYRYHAERR